MSLPNALARLSSVDHADALLRDILLVLQAKSAEWTESRRIALLAGLPVATAETALEALEAAHVVDCDGGSPRACRLRSDPVVRREIDLYLRREAGRAAKLQQNVARFRQRYEPR